MPYRQPHFLMILLGGAIVLFCLLFRISPQRIMQRAPRWLTRAIAAGLTVFVTWFPGLVDHPQHGSAFAVEAKKKAARILEESEVGKELIKNWVEVDRLLGAGIFRPSSEEKEQYLKNLEKAGESLKNLETQGVLSPEETQTLIAELGESKSRLSRYPVFPPPPKPSSPLMTCYIPVHPAEIIRNSLDRIEKRLPILEKLASQSLSPFVVEKACLSLEKELIALRGVDNLKAEEVDQERVTLAHLALTRIFRSLKPDLKKEFERVPRPRQFRFSLKGIQEEAGQPVALMQSGRFVLSKRKGEKFEGYEVLEIRKNSVVMYNPYLHNRFTLNLNPVARNSTELPPESMTQWKLKGVIFSASEPVALIQNPQGNIVSGHKDETSNNFKIIDIQKDSVVLYDQKANTHFTLQLEE